MQNGSFRHNRSCECNNGHAGLNNSILIGFHNPMSALDSVSLMVAPAILISLIGYDNSMAFLDALSLMVIYAMVSGQCNTRHNWLKTVILIIFVTWCQSST